MDIRNIVLSTKKEENEQTKAAVRNSIFSEVEERIMNSNLKTREAVVKFLKDKGVDCDNNNLSDDDAVKVSELMELIDFKQKSKEEAKKSKSSADKQIDNDSFLLESNMNNTQKVQERQNQSSAVGDNEFSIFQKNDYSKKNINVSPKETNKQQPKDRKSEESIELTKEELSEIEKEAKKLGLEGEVAKGYISGRKEELINEKLKDLEPLGNIPDGYELRNVGKDGNCFYRSVAHIVNGNENNYLSIRNSAAEIASNLEEKVKGLKATYGIDDNRKLEDLDEGVLNDALGNIPFMNIIRQGFGYAKNGTIETIGDALYVLERIRKSLSTDRKEGGEAELYFISAAIRRPVVIYDNNGNVTGYSPTLSPDLGRFLGQEDISMLGNDKVMVYREGVGDNGHFQALVKK